MAKFLAVLFFVFQKPLSVVLLLNLPSSFSINSSLFQSELKFYWGPDSPNPLSRFAPSCF